MPFGYVSNRTIRAKLIAGEGTYVEVTASIEYEHDIRAGRGHTMGHLWAIEWPLEIDMTQIFTLELPTGNIYRIYFISPTNVHTEMQGCSSLETKFILESHIRADEHERT